MSEQDGLTRRGLLGLAAGVYGFGFAPAAWALNPQPLPPGMRRAPTKRTSKGKQSGASSPQLSKQKSKNLK